MPRISIACLAASRSGATGWSPGAGTTPSCTMAVEAIDRMRVEKSRGGSARGASFSFSFTPGILACLRQNALDFRGFDNQENPMTAEYVPGLAGVPAARSKVCLIDGQAGLLSYRGYDVTTLAENSTFEEVAYLLLKGQMPTRSELDGFIGELRSHRQLKFRIIDLIKTLPESGHPMDALVATLSAVGMFYPHSIMDTPEQRWGATVRILTKVPTMVAAY